jgi:hypothetical protein
VSVARSARLPEITGGGIRALGQGAPWRFLTLSGGKVLGVAFTGGAGAG